MPSLQATLLLRFLSQVRSGLRVSGRLGRARQGTSYARRFAGVLPLSEAAHFLGHHFSTPLHFLELFASRESFRILSQDLRGCSLELGEIKSS